MVEPEDKIMAYKCTTKACVYLADRGSGASTATSGMKLLRRLDDFDAGGKSYRLAFGVHCGQALCFRLCQ